MGRSTKEIYNLLDRAIAKYPKNYMYPAGGALPVDELDSGTFLLSGPAMSGKYELLVDLLATGLDRGDGALFVTTNESSRKVFADIEGRLGRTPENLRIVDCASENQGSDGDFPAEQVAYVSSPADLTGIGIGVSEQLRELAESDAGNVRVGFYSLTTLLMYSDLETVFRFMHVLTGRIDGVGGLGVFAIDPSTHDEGTVNTLKQLFDGMIETREADDGNEVRLVGVADAPDGWTPRP